MSDDKSSKKVGLSVKIGRYLVSKGIGIRAKVIATCVFIMATSAMTLAYIAWYQVSHIGDHIRDIASEDVYTALNEQATENFERLATDVANEVANFLHDRDADIRVLASMHPAERHYSVLANKTRRIIRPGRCVLSLDGQSWMRQEDTVPIETSARSTNRENEDRGAFRTRRPDPFEYDDVPLYDEITYIDLDGNELVKVTTASNKRHYPLDPTLRNVADRNNTYIKAERYFEALRDMEPGEIYVSDVIGAYVPTNHLGMYVPDALKRAEERLGYEIPYDPEAQAYAGTENPNGRRFEGIVRWATPVADASGRKVGYVTFALNHDHLMEFVAHRSPTSDRYVEMSGAKNGSYAFMLDHETRSISHPRHSAICGYDPATGEPEVPWLDDATYKAWKSSGMAKWFDFVERSGDTKSEDLAISIDRTIGRSVEEQEVASGNYAFMLDNKCRNIGHPRHSAICGYDPATGEPQVPWLEESVYQAWKASGVARWYDFVEQSGVPEFDEQSRGKQPSPELARAGLVGLDGRYLNNAPQCTGWMDLTEHGGSGSFYVLWDGIYKLTSAAAIPYYTGQYAPSEKNGWSRRGFGIVAIGAGLDWFTLAAEKTGRRIETEIGAHMDDTFKRIARTSLLQILVILATAFLVASWVARHINSIIEGIGRYRRGEMHFRFNAPVKDEFGQISDAFDEMADGISDNFSNPLTITDMDHKIIFMNDSALEICGVTIDDVIGRPYEETSIYPHDTQYDPIEGLVDGFEPAVYHLESRDLYFKPKAHYMLNSNGEPSGYFIESINVTEMQKMQNALTDAMNEVTEANMHKSAFLARMSHEIRTPMNAVVGLTSIIRKMIDDLPREITGIKAIDDHVVRIEASSKHLLGLLNDVLDISKIDSGKIDIEPTTALLAEMIDSMESIIVPRCEEKHITYEAEHDGFDGMLYEFDPQRLRLVLINILGNAVKFTPDGGSVRFTMKKKQERGDEHLIEFVVSDTGIGIETEALERIFMPFEQANDTITRLYGGTGLGLSISQSIVQLMGGEIKVASEPGRGAEFSFEVWIRKVGETEGDKVTLEDLEGRLEGKKILVVDDVEINRMIVTTMLEDTGAEVVEAEDGEEALDIIARSEVGEYSLVIMDIQMPKMDGYEATLGIRSLDRPDAADLPIVALSANAFQDDVQKSLDSKMNEHIAKPVDDAKIAGVLFRYVLGGKL